MKIRLHFNRVNMQRGDPRTWSAHTSKSCNMSTEVVITHQGVPVAHTVFNPDGKQPRAYVALEGTVTNRGDKTYIEVA